MNRRRTFFAGSALAAAAWLAAAPGGAAEVTLEQCVREALAKSPGARAAAARAEAARAAVTEARSAYYPRLGLAGGYTRTDNPPQAFMMQLNQRRLDMTAPGFNPNEPGDTDNYRASLTARYRLYDGGVRAAGEAMARFGAEAAEAQAEAARNDLVYEVTRGYYGALQARAFAAVQEEAVRSVGESLRVANARRQAGSALKTDVLNLEVRLAETRDDLIRARNGVQLAIAALNTAIGAELAGGETLADVPARELPPPPRPEPSAVTNRPEYRAARRMVLVGEQELRRVARQDIPTVSAFGSGDLDSGRADAWEDSYTVGVAAEWEFFSGFQSTAARRKARLELEAAREDERAAMDRLRLDLRQAWLAASEAWERRGVAAKSVESAREALRITAQRYEQGAADIVELLTAQVGLTATQTREAAAFYDYLAARVNIERACGRLGVGAQRDER